MKQSLVTRSAIFVILLAFASAPALAQVASDGPGGGIPVPIGQGGPNGNSFGPGGGIPVPIGQGGHVFGPGGGIPVPIGQGGPNGNNFGPGGGIPCPIGRGGKGAIA